MSDLVRRASRDKTANNTPPAYKVPAMSQGTRQKKPSHYGGRHNRRKTRKNIVMGPKNFKDKNEDTIYAQRQHQVHVYMMMEQPNQQQQQQQLGRKSTKKPPPKPKRLYLEKEWSSSPSPPNSPDISDFELVPPIAPKGPPPRPPLPNLKSLPIAIPNGSSGRGGNKKLPEKYSEKAIASDFSPERKPRPMPKPRLQKAKDASVDMNIEELKSKLRTAQRTAETGSVGSAMLKLTPPIVLPASKKASPPPGAQRAAQAKLQPLLPPRQGRTKNLYVATKPGIFLNAGEENEGRPTSLQGVGKKDVVRSTDDVLHQKHKSKPLPKPPSPVPRTKVQSHREGDDSPMAASVHLTPAQPVPVPKSRNGNGTKAREEQGPPLRGEDGNGVHKNSTPHRPVPAARAASKETKETSSRSNGGTGLAKPPIPRKRFHKESLTTESPTRERHPPPSYPLPPSPLTPSHPSPPAHSLPPSPSSQPHPLPPLSANPSDRASARLSGSSPYDRTRSKRKKGGGIRAPLWKAPPPPDFTPPPTPSYTPKKSPKRPPLPAIGQILDTPTSTSTRSSFNLPPFQQSPIVSAADNATPSVFLMPSTATDSTHQKPIKLAQTSVSPARGSTEIEFEENLYENKSIKRKRRVPSGQNILPLNIVHELQNNFRIQARR